MAGLVPEAMAVAVRCACELVLVHLAHVSREKIRRRVRFFFFFCSG